MFSYLPSGPRGFAFGRFTEGDGTPFTGLVAGGRVRALPEPDTDVATVLQRWPLEGERLREAACDASARWHAEAELTVLVPVRPRQILQAGANYRRHVVDIVVTETDDDSQGATEADKRAYAEAMMDRRVREGEPYVFLGAPSALCGALYDIVLPVRAGALHDWELELAVVIGRDGTASAGPTRRRTSAATPSPTTSPAGTWSTGGTCRSWARTGSLPRTAPRTSRSDLSLCQLSSYLTRRPWTSPCTTTAPPASRSPQRIWSSTSRGWSSTPLTGQR